VDCYVPSFFKLKSNITISFPQFRKVFH
jgi:hypothetical protein